MSSFYYPAENNMGSNLFYNIKELSYGSLSRCQDRFESSMSMRIIIWAGYYENFLKT
jgi:hypothetical protein